MNDIKEHLLMRIKEGLEQINISSDIIDELEEYFEGTINSEDYLNKLPKVDFQNMKYDQYDNLKHAFSSIEKHIYKDYLKKYFDILYKMSREAVSEIVMPNYGREEKNNELIAQGIEEEKVIGVYLNDIVYDRWSLDSLHLKDIYKMCRERREFAKKVIENLDYSIKNSYITNNAILLLKTIYCYENFKYEEDICKVYIEDIEKFICENIERMFGGSLIKEEISRIEEIINSKEKFNEEENRELIEALKSKLPPSYNREYLNYKVAISCLNKENSQKIDNFILLLMNIACEDTVKKIIEMTTVREGHNKLDDKTCNIPAKYFIAYKSKRGNCEFLIQRFKDERQAFKDAIGLCEETEQNELMAYCFEDEVDGHIYIKRVEDNCKRYINIVFEEYDMDIELIQEIEEFLNDDDNMEFENIRTKLNLFKGKGINFRYKIGDVFKSGMKALSNIKENAVYEKIIAILFALNEGVFIGEISDVSIYSETNKEIKFYIKNYNIADKYEISVEDQMFSLDLLVTNYSYERIYKKPVEAVAKKLLQNHRSEVLKNIKSVSPVGRTLYLRLVYLEESEENVEVILDNFGDTSKFVKDHIIEILEDSVKYLDKVLEKLHVKKQGEREVAVRVLESWMRNYKVSKENKIKITENLNSLLEREKSQKIRSLLMKVLNIEEIEEKNGTQESDDEFIKNILKGNKKSSLKWIDFEALPKVKFKESNENCSTEYLQAIFICYSSLGRVGRSIDGERLAAKLDEFDLESFVNEVFDIWMENGAEAKKKYILSIASKFGGEKIILKLKKNIETWAKNSRGAMACEGVLALALSGRDNGLLVVDGISRKFKYNSVKSAAKKALDFAAKELEIDREELSDRIVSPLGFDKNGQRTFDYGARKFTVTLAPSLQLEIFDENEKKIKNLPKPGKKDDEEQSKVSYDEFKVLKKQLKNTIANQSSRLDEALAISRRWSVNSWKKLFVENPVMHAFAMGLIWGVYEGDELKDTFRYMEDGTFNTKDEEEFTLFEDGFKESWNIGLVHPMDCSNEDIEAWKTQLEDYEIVQPIEQLNRKVFIIPEDEKDNTETEIFAGKIINGLSLSGKLLKFGWYRGDIYDGGWYCEFYKFNDRLKIYVEFNFKGLPVGFENEDTTARTVKFYKAENENKIKNAYGKNKDKYLVKLKVIPKKLYSEVMCELDRALASSSGFDHNWREDY